MRILITGIAGFIGHHLAVSLLNAGHELIGVDNLNDYYDIELKKMRLKDLGIKFTHSKKNTSINYKGLVFYHRDINDKKFWEDIICFGKLDYVVHLAAQAGVRYSLTNPTSYIDNNIKGFVSVLEYCKDNNTTLLYASSSSVYGNSEKKPFNELDPCLNPLSVYAMSKRSNELLASTYNHLYGLKSVGFRFFTVYGPYGRPDMAPFLFTKAAFENKEIQVFNFGNQYRDFTYVQDIIDGIILVLNSSKPIGCEIYNLGKGQPVLLGDFIELIEDISNRKITKKYIEAQSGDSAYTYADMKKFQSHYNYNPKIDIREGILYFIEWYKKYNSIITN